MTYSGPNNYVHIQVTLHEHPSFWLSCHVHKTQCKKNIICSSQFLFICRENIKWSVCISSTEIWKHFLWKSTRVGAQTSVSERVDESQLSFVKVQLQSDDIRPFIAININDRFISFLVCTIHVTKTPKMTLWIHFVNFFAVHCFPHHSQCPVVIVSYLYVPAVHTWAEALWGQHSHM